MTIEKKSPCAKCTGNCSGCKTTTKHFACPGESWRCWLKKGHIITVGLGLIIAFGSKIFERVVDALFPPQDKTEEKQSVPSENALSTKGLFSVIKVIEQLDNGQQIALIQPINTDLKTLEEKPNQPERSDIQTTPITVQSAKTHQPPLSQHINE